MFKGISTFNITGSYDVTDVNPSTEAPRNGTTSVWKKTIFVSPVKAILVFVGALLLIALVGILVAMFGPGSEDLNPRISGAYGEGDKGENPSDSTTGTKSYTSISTQQTPAATTTEPPTTGSPNNKSLECGIAIVGGGVPGLLIAKELIQQNIETNVCLLEKEDHFGGRIYDHTFQQHVPDVSVGLGALKVEEEDRALKKILSELNVTTEDWNFVKPVQLEARGVFATGYSELKAKAFPTLLKHPRIQNYSIEEIAIYISNNNSQQQLHHNLFSTAETFLSNFLSPEGTKLIEGAFGFSGSYMQLINPFSYRTYLWDAVNQKNSNRRPRNGMSELTNEMLKMVRNFGVKTFIKEEVKTINSAGDKFIIESTNMTVTANKVVLTVTPMATRKMDGDVPRGVVDHEIFKSIQSVPAFNGAAVYNQAWWNDSFSHGNDSLRPLQQFVSSSNCLGITMPYKGRGPNGEAVLQTMANNGACSRKWADILKLSKSMLDKEMRRALEYKFNQPVPRALDTHYKYWEEGYWFFQKPGYHHTPQRIRHWAKKPLTGKNVFLVGSAYYTFGGSLNDAILSAQNALREIGKV